MNTANHPAARIPAAGIPARKQDNMTTQFRTFFVDFYPGERDLMELATSTIQLHQDVFDAVDETWLEMYYDLATDNQVVEYIAYEILVKRRQLNQIDGFANLANTLIRVKDWPDFDFYMEVTEKTKCKS